MAWTNSITAKHAAPKAAGSEITKEAFHHVEPRSAGGCEVNVEPRMALQPALNDGMFVSGVVVHDQVQLLVAGRGIVHQAQEAEPLLVPWRSDHFAVQSVERSE